MDNFRILVLIQGHHVVTHPALFLRDHDKSRSFVVRQAFRFHLHFLVCQLTAEKVRQVCGLCFSFRVKHRFFPFLVEEVVVHCGIDPSELDGSEFPLQLLEDVGIDRFRR